MFTNEFVSLCKAFAKSRNDVLGEELEDSKKVCKYTVKFYAYSIEFRYVKKESVFFKASSLYCVLRTRKTSVVYYHLPDLIPFLKDQSFKSCYFWHIESPQRLSRCFESLCEILDSITAQLAPFLLEDSPLAEALFASYKWIYNLKDTDIDFSKVDNPKDPSQEFFLSLQEMRDGYLFSRFTNFTPYVLLRKNKIQKALGRYEKLNRKGKLLEYEKQLLDHVSHLNGEAFCPFQPGCDTTVSEKLNAPVSTFLGFVLVFLVSSLLFCSGFAIYNFIISMNTQVVLSAPWYLGFLCAGLCSIFGAIAMAAIKPMPNKHLTKEERENFAKLLHSKGLKTFSLAAFLLSVAASIFFAVMILISNVRFYDEHIAFERKAYPYEQIHGVYYIESRYNVYDQRIERASYVILFDDKTALDLDGYASIELTEKEVLPLLEEKGFNVQGVASDKDLPWYVDTNS